MKGDNTMIKEFETQMMLTEKTNALLEEIKAYTEEMKEKNEKNLDELKKQVEVDMKEIVDYCIKMGIPRNKTGWDKPAERFRLLEGKNIAFEICYDTKKDKYEWHIGLVSSGIGYCKCEGLFCTNASFSGYKPVWH
jgi:hypothetical protein